jgi:hypothetical protein
VRQNKLAEKLSAAQKVSEEYTAAVAEAQAAVAAVATTARAAGLALPDFIGGDGTVQKEDMYVVARVAVLSVSSLARSPR